MIYTYLLIMTDSLLLRPSLYFDKLVDTSVLSISNFTQVHFTTLHFFPFKLHPTTLHSTSVNLSTLHFLSFKLHPNSLHYASLHFTTLSFGLTPFKFPTAPFHLTSPHFISLHVQTVFTTIPFLPLLPIYYCSPNSLSGGFRFTRESP